MVSLFVSSSPYSSRRCTSWVSLPLQPHVGSWGGGDVGPVAVEDHGEITHQPHVSHSSSPLTCGHVCRREDSHTLGCQLSGCLPAGCLGADKAGCPGTHMGTAPGNPLKRMVSPPPPPLAPSFDGGRCHRD